MERNIRKEKEFKWQQKEMRKKWKIGNKNKCSKRNMEGKICVNDEENKII